MGRFFSYDNCRNKHSFYTYQNKNENGEIISYTPFVHRVNAKTGGYSERISDNFSELKDKEFPSEKLARDYAINFFEKLEKEI